MGTETRDGSEVLAEFFRYTAERATACCGSPDTDSWWMIPHGDRAWTATDSSQLAISWTESYGASSPTGAGLAEQVCH